jgi:hypothetical protein
MDGKPRPASDRGTTRRTEIIASRRRGPGILLDIDWRGDVKLRLLRSVLHSQPAISGKFDALQGCFAAQGAAPVRGERAGAEMRHVPLLRGGLHNFGVAGLL